MAKRHVEHVIHALNASTRSIESQITIDHWLWRNDLGPHSDGVKRTTIDDEIGDTLDHTVRTSLSHLEDVELVEEFLEYNTTFVIAEWHRDVFIMGQVEEAANEGIQALIADFEDWEPADGDAAIATDGSGSTLRQVVADKFDLHPTAVEDYLQDGDPVERLNEAVDAIDESDDHDVGPDYGEIAFRNPAYRYRLTEIGKRLYEL